MFNGSADRNFCAWLFFHSAFPSKIIVSPFNYGSPLKYHRSADPLSIIFHTIKPSGGVSMDELLMIMQGDQYSIPFYINYIDEKNDNEVCLTPELVNCIEICIGYLRKTTPSIVFNSEEGFWEFPLTQQESFSLEQKTVEVKIRVALVSGDVIGKKVGTIFIERSASKEELH